MRWRRIFMQHLQKVVQLYPPTIETRLEDLADMLTDVFEGGIILLTFSIDA